MASAKPPFAEQEDLSGIYPVHNVRCLSGSDLVGPLTLPSPPGQPEERVRKGYSTAGRASDQANNSAKDALAKSGGCPPANRRTIARILGSNSPSPARS